MPCCCCRLVLSLVAIAKQTNFQASTPHTLITCPLPRTKSKGELRSTELSNLLPSVYKVPCAAAQVRRSENRTPGNYSSQTLGHEPCSAWITCHHCVIYARIPRGETATGAQDRDTWPTEEACVTRKTHTTAHIPARQCAALHQQANHLLQVRHRQAQPRRKQAGQRIACSKGDL